MKPSAVYLDDAITLTGNYFNNVQVNISMQSTVLRELTYYLEHSIHRQALIKVGLPEQGLGHLLNKNFGLAPAGSA
jgi:hypothetical protein